MRRARHLFEALVDPDHLDDAAAATVRGKRRRPDVAAFLLRRDESLGRLRGELSAGAWRPTGWVPRSIRDPKPRVIAVAPIDDRVVHTALTSVLGPPLVRSLTDDVFACRKGFGVHRALLRLQSHLRRSRWFVHLDVRSYFPSIRLDILRRLIGRRIADRRVLALTDLLLEAGRGFYDPVAVRRDARLSDDWPPRGQGLPIGALTSQLFAAHLYLDGLDHHVKRDLKVPGYVRYVDDLILFGGSRAQVAAWRDAVAAWLFEERGLLLKAPRARPRRCTGTLHALGRLVTCHRIEPRPSAWRDWAAYLAQEVLEAGRVRRRPDVPRVVAARVGHLLFP